MSVAATSIPSAPIAPAVGAVAGKIEVYAYAAIAGSFVVSEYGSKGGDGQKNEDADVFSPCELRCGFQNLSSPSFDAGKSPIPSKNDQSGLCEVTIL